MIEAIPVTTEPKKQPILKVDTNLVDELCDAQKADPTTKLPTLTEFLNNITIKE